MWVRDRVTITVSYIVRTTKMATADHDRDLSFLNEVLAEPHASSEPACKLRPVAMGRSMEAKPMPLDIGSDNFWIR